MVWQSYCENKRVHAILLPRVYIYGIFKDIDFLTLTMRAWCFNFVDSFLMLCLQEALLSLTHRTTMHLYVISCLRPPAACHMCAKIAKRSVTAVLFNAPMRIWRLYWGWLRRKFTVWSSVGKLEWWGHQATKKVWWYVERFRHNTPTWQTDERTDGHRTARL